MPARRFRDRVDAAKLRLQGSALAAALASPAVGSALADVSYRTGAGHTTGLSVVYHQVEPLTTVVRESAVSPEQEFEVAWRGGDGLLDQMPDPEPVARMVEHRAQGLGFGRIARAIGCARITVSRYLRSFEEESR